MKQKHSAAHRLLRSVRALNVCDAKIHLIFTIVKRNQNNPWLYGIPHLSCPTIDEGIRG